MATNGNNNGTINYSENPSIQSGVFGYAQGNAERRNFSNSFWKDGGYLSESIKELEAMRDTYAEMSKLSSKMTTAEKSALREKKRELKQQLDILYNYQETQEVSDKEAIDSIKQSNKLRLQGLAQYQKLLAKLADTDEENRDKWLDDLNQAEKTYTKIKETSSDINSKLDTSAKILNKTSSDFSSSMAKTLNSFGDNLRDLSNMFSLQAIANSSLEQSARSKASIITDVSKQFGFTSNSQFESFKNSLNDTLKDMNSEMGNIFNSSDLKQYMSSLSEFGITSTSMAEQQMKNSIIATKYLGVSNETQTAIFKFMKLTNNNDALNNYNKTIVGLLKSDLGVSKEQLDALTQMATADQDKLLASGMSADTYAKYIEQYDTTGAVLKSMYGDSVANSIMGVVSELAQSSYLDADTLIRKYGADAIPAMTKLQNTGDVKSVIEMLTGSAVGWGNVSGDNAINATYQASLGASNPAALVGFNMLHGDLGEFSQTTSDILSGLKDISDLDVKSYVQETTTTTYLEKIQNWLDTFINGINWKTTMNLANTALIAYLAAKPFEIYGFFKNLNLTNLLTNKLGKGSAMWEGGEQLSLFNSGGGKVGSVLSKITTVAGGIALGLTAANVIKAGIESYYNKEFSSNVNAAAANFKGTNLEGNSLAATVEGAGNTYNDSNHGFFGELASGWSSTTRGIGVYTLGWTRDLATINKDDWAFMQEAINMHNMSPEQVKAYTLAWGLLLMSAGRQSDIPEFSSMTPDEIKATMSHYGFTKEYLNAVVSSFGGTMTKPNKSKGENQEYIDWSGIGLDGYKKNGLDYVHKDNYKALLHKGEMVLTAEEADLYRQMLGQGGVSDKTPRGKGRIITGLPWPMTAGYPSYPSGGQHRGLDFGIPVGTKVGAAVSGTIVNAHSQDNYNTYPRGPRIFGQYILMKGDNGLYYRYGHLSKVGVSNNQRVKAGETIGLSGNTGYSSGPHLHWQVQTGTSNSTDISPYSYITNSLFKAKGDIGKISDYSNPTSGNSDEDSSIKVQAKKFIPKAFSNNMGGAEDSAGRVVNSVDGGFNKLITYLEGIREEQAAQREIINAFSKSRVSESNFS